MNNYPLLGVVLTDITPDTVREQVLEAETSLESLDKVSVGGDPTEIIGDVMDAMGVDVDSFEEVQRLRQYLRESARCSLEALQDFELLSVTPDATDDEFQDIVDGAAMDGPQKTCQNHVVTLPYLSLCISECQIDSRVAYELRVIDDQISAMNTTRINLEVQRAAGLLTPEQVQAGDRAACDVIEGLLSTYRDLLDTVPDHLFDLAPKKEEEE